MTSMTPVDAQSSPAPTLVWFRDDLRIADNTALRWAADRGAVIGIVINERHDDPRARPPGSAARWWRARCIAVLEESLAESGVPLLQRAGDPVEILPSIVEELGCGGVTWNRRYHEPLRNSDAQLKQLLTQRDIEVHSHPGFLLCEPWEVSTAQGSPYKVFTPFSRSARPVAESAVSSACAGTPKSLHGPDTTLHDHAHQGNASDEPAWAQRLSQYHHPGEQAALTQLSAFLDRLAGGISYADERDQPSKDATSRLSAHLSVGTLSVHRVWMEIARAADADDISAEDATALQTELLWRDFAWHRLYARPDLHTRNVREQFDRFGWEWDKQEMPALLSRPRDPRYATADDEFHLALAAWRSGATGIPLVDAGMRELWETGTMHNRVRMVVASFLTKNLQIHWRHGEEWFWETLVDADPASNAFNWQWAAGSGDDASPYFRIFNPLTQAKKFDPDSVYISRWVPDIGSAGYPSPIVDVKESRQAALDAYAAIKD